MTGTAALLLAAGESSRMGEPKALLPWQGTTLLEHQLAALESAGVSRTVVVLGHQPERLQPLIYGRQGVRWVHNPDYRKGKTTSIRAGLHALIQSQATAPDTPGEEAILLLNVDQPRSSSIIRLIIRSHFESARPGHPSITVPTYQGKGGHPVVLSAHLMDELMQMSESTQGLKAVVRRHGDDVVRVELDAPEILLDLNTLQDYHRALRQSGQA